MLFYRVLSLDSHEGRQSAYFRTARRAVVSIKNQGRKNSFSGFKISLP
jgi:hypothetical protein